MSNQSNTKSPLETLDRTSKVLIFGGTGAIGSALCKAFSKQKMRVAFTFYKNEEKALQLQTEYPNSKAFQVDLESVASIQKVSNQAIKFLDGIDIFVHCAAIGLNKEDHGSRSIKSISESDWDRMLAINTKSAFFAVQALESKLSQSQHPAIILLGSMDGRKPIPSPVHYAISKASLIRMSEALAKELGSKGICVNVVSPGVLEEGLSLNLPKFMREDYKKHSGMQRFGKLEEVVSVVTWLALKNTYITGQSFLLDGAL